MRPGAAAAALVATLPLSACGAGGSAECVIKVYFRPGATQAQIDAVRQSFEADGRVAGVTFVSKDEALRTMKEQHPELVQDLTHNPLPDALEVTAASDEATDDLVSELDRRPPGVDQVRVACDGDEPKLP